MSDLQPSRTARVMAIAIPLVLGSMLLTAILFAHSPDTPSFFPSLYPHPLDDAGNLLRDGIYRALGFGSYLLAFGSLLLSFRYLLFRESWDTSRRLMGLLVFFPGVLLVLDVLTPHLGSGHLAGSGGSCGALLATTLRSFFPLPVILAGSLAVSAVGLWLLADGVLRRLARGIRWSAWQQLLLISELLYGFGWLLGWIAQGCVMIASWIEQQLGREARCILTSVVSSELAPTTAPHTSESTLQPEAAQRASLPRTLLIRASELPADPDPVASTTEVSSPVELKIVHGDKRTLAESKTASTDDLPPLDLLDQPPPPPSDQQDTHLLEVAALIEKAFSDFGLTVKVVGIHTGPVITQYEIALELGLRVARVTSLADDLALQLKVQSVRIVAPIPGKNTVGIEVPNEKRAVVRMKELVLAASERIAKQKMPLFLGKDTEGRPLVVDLAEMPHLLIAGRTGTGKSVCLNSIILSLLLTRRPEECKLLMIDPKQVELAEYGRLPHLMHPVITDTTKAEAILSWAVDKMEERYDILRRARVRNITSYNELSYEEIMRRVAPVDHEERKRIPYRMPYIVMVVDEVGDLMMQMKKEVEGHIIRLAQKSRAAGIHLILTTQRPTVDVITGLIKSNLPARICFQVADRSNSRVVLDEVGAEKLLGKGDMLFLQPSTSSIIRAQGTYASDAEILRVVSFLEVEQPAFDQELMEMEEKPSGVSKVVESLKRRDELYEEAIEIVIREGRGSVSLLQRALGIGYGRAARLIDFMAEDGIVGDYNGAQAREVLFTPEQWAQMKHGSDPLAESA